MKVYEPGSFRDPSGVVFYESGSVFRELASATRDFFQSQDYWKFLDRGVAEGRVLPSFPVSSPSGEFLIRQERLPFYTHSYEWSFGMLREAALLTLDLQRDCMESGFSLKDASAFNIAFVNGQPKFVDVLSFVKSPESQGWPAYRQFCQSFLFPLLMESHLGFDSRSVLKSHLAEVPIRIIAGMIQPWHWPLPGVFKEVVLQNLLERHFGQDAELVEKSASAVSIPRKKVEANLLRLRKIVESLRPPKLSSTWATRYERDHSYTADETAVKSAFLERVLSRRKPARLLDLGCNSGAFTVIAANHAQTTLGIDLDPGVVDLAHAKAKAKSSRASFAVADLANPSPAMGWGLVERHSLLDRMGADFFLALALVHHLRVSAKIPFERIIQQLKALGPDGIVEWVDPADPAVAKLMALQAGPFEDFKWENFRRILESNFELREIVELGGGKRKLCHISVSQR